MNLYVINNTEWNCPDAFVFQVFSMIYSRLQDLGVDVSELTKDLGVVFVEEEDMLGLNTNFRGKHYATDVLSFKMDGDVLGEIVLCPQVIVKQANEHELHESEEFVYLFLHGILHLLGYDHEQDTTRAEEMFNLQDKVFEGIQDAGIVAKFEKSLS